MILSWTGPTGFHFLGESWMWGGSSASAGGGGSSVITTYYLHNVLMAQ